jgi:hypothetical protein
MYAIYVGGSDGTLSNWMFPKSAVVVATFGFNVFLLGWLQRWLPPL